MGNWVETAGRLAGSQVAARWMRTGARMRPARNSFPPHE